MRAQAGDEDAREKLIEGNLRLVLSVIQRFDKRGENPDDLFQVGCIGLIKAISNFDPDKQGIKFTYPKCYTDLAMHERHDTLVFLLDRLTDNSRWLLGQYDVKVAESRFKIGNYAYSVNFELRNDVSFTVLVGRYATPESATGYAYDTDSRSRDAAQAGDRHGQ